MIDPLSDIKAVTILREIKTSGHSPLEVVADDYKTYFVKSTEGKNPCYYLISEFLCHYLLKCWHIPTPDIAAVTINPDLIPDNYSSKHKKRFYQKECFGSQSITDAIDLSLFFQATKKPDFKKFYNPEILFKIALFDIWVENDDRKPSNNNILLQPVDGRYKIFAIDHAYTFSTMKYEDLNPEFVSSSFNDSILLSPLGQSVIKQTKIKQEWINQTRENFYLCLRNCEQHFLEITKNIPQHLGFDLRLQECIKVFLFEKQRNGKVFEEFTARLT